MHDILGSNVNWLELAWLLVTSIGFMFSFAGVVDAWRDLLALKTSRARFRGMRFVIALSNLRRELVFTLVQLVFVVIGLVAASLPTRPDAPQTGNVGTVVTAVGFIVSALAIMLDSVLARRERKHAIGLYRSEMV